MTLSILSRLTPRTALGAGALAAALVLHLFAAGGGWGVGTASAATRPSVAPTVLRATTAGIVGGTSAAPVITAQPQSKAVGVGNAARFSVTATASGPIAYRWSRAGVPIADATGPAYQIDATQLADNGAAFSVVVTGAAGATTSVVARLTVNAVLSAGARADRPFSDRSLWNARPTRFTLGSDTIPTSSYWPTITQGPWSVAGTIAATTDPAVTVLPLVGQPGVWTPDAEAFAPQIVIPHWPATVAPAAGSDGHADIIDVAANKIHSFWQLKQVAGQWRAQQYTWTALDGTGWGTPAQYMQGSRATGVVPIAGVIRKTEIDDGQPMYRHALALSLTYNALAKSPTYVFPATSGDGDAAKANSGTIPEGTRLMLPATFDLSTITDPRLVKIAQTLKTYGAYVVDRNYGTPYVIYVENGSNFNLMPNGWNTSIATQLDTIRAALRAIAQVTEWVDATGAVFTPERNLEMLSMRGAWTLTSGATAGTFDSWDQSVVFADNGQRTVQTNYGDRSMPSVRATPPAAGQLYRLRVRATAGATFRLQLRNATMQYDSGPLAAGADIVFAWPASAVQSVVTVTSGPSGGGRVGASVIAMP